MDVVQDALVHALGAIEDFTYENEGDFVRWLSRIAENVLRDNWDRFQAEKRDLRKEVRLDNYRSTTGGGFVGTPGPMKGTTPSVIMSRKEDLAKLERAIDTLKPEYRNVIVLTKIEGLSYKEMADRLGKSSEAVRKLVSRAMTALINAFESVK
jgi:RNA polymerase sigma-70 factor (ECF subfamily)